MYYVGNTKEVKQTPPKGYNEKSYPVTEQFLFENVYYHTFSCRQLVISTSIAKQYKAQTITH